MTAVHASRRDLRQLQVPLMHRVERAGEQHHRRRVAPAPRQLAGQRAVGTHHHVRTLAGVELRQQRSGLEAHLELLVRLQGQQRGAEHAAGVRGGAQHELAHHPLLARPVARALGEREGVGGRPEPVAHRHHHPVPALLGAVRGDRGGASQAEDGNGHPGLARHGVGRPVRGRDAVARREGAGAAPRLRAMALAVRCDVACAGVKPIHSAIERPA